MKYDPFSYRYPSRRNLVYGSRGMVATSHPLAAAAGMDVMKKGGNAIDAAVATAAALTVVEPVANGIGSDAFALVWHDGKLQGLNGSGWSPANYSLERLRSMGHSQCAPRFGWGGATIPGAPAVWAELARGLGRLPLTATLAPAIAYAREGTAVSVNVSFLWKEAWNIFSHLKEDVHRPWFETFCPESRGFEAGEIFRSPGHAETLEAIAATDARDFYEGRIAEKIVAFARNTGGLFCEEDLAAFAPEWVTPIKIDYRGYDVWEMPPNGQGLVALIALGILRGFEFSAHDCPFTVHKQIEALKMAFADASHYVADPRFSQVPVAELLSEAYLSRRRTSVCESARAYEAGDPYAGGTVYLCTADAQGNMVSYIQSNYMGFGSGVLIPGTGIALNNRAQCFSFEEGHANVAAPRKRPYNTIIPAFLSKDNRPVGPFGVMGAYMQPQGHVQVVMNSVDFGMNPQEALDAPRWQWTGEMQVSCEPGFPDNTAQKLKRMGHHVSNALHATDFGRGQIVWRTEYGTFAGATEPRTDGCVATW